MGKITTNPETEYTEEYIRKILNLRYLSSPKYLLHNLYVFEWESDFLAKTKAGYWYEVEIKISLADFKNDFKKKSKHMMLQRSDSDDPITDGLRPNYFAYCVPENLVPKVKDLVPNYAGLFGVSHGFLIQHKGMPRLHGRKITDDQLNLIEKFYYNWKEQERKNIHHDEIVRELRRKISLLKTEFKVTTGYDISECY